MDRLASVSMVQGDGGGGEVLYQAAGNQGLLDVAIARYRFSGGVAARGAGDCDWMVVHVGQETPMSCRIGRHGSEHVATPGSIVICPAGVDIVAESDMQLDTVFVALPKEPFALLALERGRVNAELGALLLSEDATLVGIVRELADRARVDGDNCGAAWRDLSSEVIEQLFERHLLGVTPRQRGVLSPDALARIYQYVEAHLGEQIEVDVLADVVQATRSHFPRLFRRSVGISPYQYVVRRRLQRAMELIRKGNMPLAQIAIETGFTDQSHLTHWAKRVYGVSPARAFGDFRTRRNLQD